ncbi:MAG: carcinine hydrolase/isopenicillin-N N-acyltransferase family protein [Candidatus Neomarinimicrobiota bacterium]
MNKLMIIIIFSFFVSIYNHVNACTICVKANNNVILVGNNEDYYEPRTKVWFFPKTTNLYGRVIWGYDRYLFPFQGGMNDQGLFVDINAIGFTNWADDPIKPNLPGDYVEYILTHCATVDDVIELFQKFDIDLGWIKLVLADAQGKSAIFEWLDGKVNVIQREGDFQVSTNYLSPNEHLENRNKIAKQILGSQKNPTIDLIRKTLAATSKDIYFGQTMYSTICDLKKKKIYLYNFHFFEEVVIFDLNEELKKGNKSYKIPSLFDITSQSEYLFNIIGTQLGARDLNKLIDEEGINVASQKFNEMKEMTRTFNQYDFPEWSLRSLGLKYLSESRFKEAIGILKLNAETYPESIEARSSLAEAHRRTGNK